jgi:hypothetical protein
MCGGDKAAHDLDDILSVLRRRDQPIACKSALFKKGFPGTWVLCLSRACLGKMIIFIGDKSGKKKKKTMLFLTVEQDADEITHTSGDPGERCDLQENGLSFFEPSLCLPRACLGTKIIFICRWLKKWRFLT